MRISDWSSDVCSSDLCKVLSKTSRPVLLIFLPSSDQCRLLAQSMPQSGGRQLIAVNPRCLTSVNNRARGRDNDSADVTKAMEMTRKVENVMTRNEIGRESSRERGCQYG